VGGEKPTPNGVGWPFEAMRGGKKLTQKDVHVVSPKVGKSTTLLQESPCLFPRREKKTFNTKKEKETCHKGEKGPALT